MVLEHTFCGVSGEKERGGDPRPNRPVPALNLSLTVIILYSDVNSEILSSY